MEFSSWKDAAEEAGFEVKNIAWIGIERVEINSRREAASTEDFDSKWLLLSSPIV